MDAAALSLAEAAAGASGPRLRGGVLPTSGDRGDQRLAPVLRLGGRRSRQDAGGDGAGRGALLDRRLHRGAHPDAGLRAVARRRFRQGAVPRDARSVGADLRACPHPVPALSSRAQDRRAIARHRARHQGHRHAALLRAVQHIPDHPAARLLCGDPVREAEHHDRGDHGGDGCGLCLVHFRDHQLAHPVPPRHERERPGRQHQGRRQPPELRDGEVLQQRGA